MRSKISLLIFFIAHGLLAQTGIVTGIVSDKFNNAPLPFAAIVIEGTSLSALTDVNGKYTINKVPPGLYNIKCQILGYQDKTLFEIQVNTNKPAVADFELTTANQELDEVVLNAQNQFEKKLESPVSLKKIGINEIQRNPGSNQDISKVVQSLPGVASSVAFRNDLIVRGGAPNENKFFIDGIEIPGINHFATQGSTGGPVGMINVNSIKDVDFYTGAFPANRGNTLSSVMEINLKNGREDKIGGLFQVGASEVGLFLEGPINEKTTFMVSARRSYLQFLFKLIELPFLPTYNDFQFKVKHNFDKKNQLTIIGLGAIDNFKLNLDANETEEQQYLLDNLADNDQWNYSIGAKYTHFRNNGYTNVVLSRYMLNNVATKYKNNNQDLEQLLNYTSQEMANKFRVEDISKLGNYNLTYGFGLEQNKYNVATINKQLPNNQIIDYSSAIAMFGYNVFANVNTTFFQEKVALSVGLRMDAQDFSDATNNLLDQFSPRISASYYITPKLSLNGNWGVYYQLPPNTTLGYRNSNEELVNTQVSYIRSQHFVAGFAYLFDISSKLSIEGFIKQYSQYPFLFPEMVSLANLGSDFGVVGNRMATSTNQGFTRGLEIAYEQKLFKGFYGIGSITLVRSEFEDSKGELVSSSWDNKVIATVSLGKKFKNNWELGMRYQYLGGAPYTPYNVSQSALKENWDNIQSGIVDYTQLNTQNQSNFNGLNLRIDKKWYFKKISLDVYLDVQNALNATAEGRPYLTVQKDAQGNPIEDPNDSSRYLMKELPNISGSRIPSMGIILEF